MLALGLELSRPCLTTSGLRTQLTQACSTHTEVWGECLLGRKGEL